MPLFCAVAKAAMRFRENHKVFPSHTALALLSTQEFESVFTELLADEKARSALAPLQLLQTLPDRTHWLAHLPDTESEAGWASIANAVAMSLHHRSTSAID